MKCTVLKLFKDGWEFPLKKRQKRKRKQTPNLAEKSPSTKPSACLAFCTLQPPVKGGAMYMYNVPFLHVWKFATQNMWSSLVYLGKRLLNVFLLFHLQCCFQTRDVKIILVWTLKDVYFLPVDFVGKVLACLTFFPFPLAVLLFVGEIYTGLTKLMEWKSLPIGIVSCVHLDPVLPVPCAECPYETLNMCHLYVLYITYIPPLSRMVYIKCS